MLLNGVFMHFVDYLFGGFKNADYFRRIIWCISSIELKKAPYKKLTQNANNTCFDSIEKGQ